jgi:hypothetical protein
MPYAKERQGFGFWSWFKPRKQVWYDDDARPVAIEWLLQKGRWDPALQKKTGPTSEAPAEPSKPIPRIPKGVDMILDPEPMSLEDAYGSVNGVGRYLSELDGELDGVVPDPPPHELTIEEVERMGPNHAWNPHTHLWEPIYTMGQDEPSGFVRGRQSR